MKNNLLEIQNVSLRLPGMEKSILSDINYTVNRNDFIIVLGSNGSGKSSLLKLLNKSVTPVFGSILFQNERLNRIADKSFSRSIKMLNQNTHESLFVSLTVMENYLIVKQSQESGLLGMSSRGERKFFADYIKKFNHKLSDKLDQRVEELSGGEKQALALALTVLYPPEILLLDEHTSALDPVSAKKLMLITAQMIKDSKITCLLATHDLSIAQQYGNRILALQNGKILQAIEQPVKVELTQEYLLSACY
jgi:putative tryptophan/tyrosine transport system ATP-binding protein